MALDSSGVTNVVIATTNQVVTSSATVQHHHWVIHVGDALFGFYQQGDGPTCIWLGEYMAEVPFSAPVTAAGFVLIVLLLLVAGYYLIANLRHKSVPDRDKLD